MKTKHLFLRLLLFLAVWAVTSQSYGMMYYYQYNIHVASNPTGANMVYKIDNNDAPKQALSSKQQQGDFSNGFLFSFDNDSVPSGYFFLGWSKDKVATQSEDVTATNNPGYLSIQAIYLGLSFGGSPDINPDKKQLVYANFTRLKVLTADENQGTAYIYNTPFQVLDGDQVRIKATTKPGYEFVGWQLNDNPGYASTANPYNFTISDATAGCYKACFQPSTSVTAHQVIIDQQSLGTVVADKPTATAGETVTLTITPDIGYEATLVKYDNIDANRVDDTHFTFVMPNDDVYITVSCTPINYTITYNLDGGTVGSPNPAKYTVDTEAFTLNNPTKTGYTFAGWTGTDLTEPASSITIEKGSTGNRTYTANWTLNTYTVSFDKNADDATGDEMVPMHFTYGEEKALSLNTFSR